MTHDELHRLLTEEYGITGGEILAHDQAQRDQIAALTKKVADLTAWYDIMMGTPCEEIRHAQQLEEAEEKYKDLTKQAVRFASILRDEWLGQWCELLILDPDDPTTVDVVAKHDADFQAAVEFLASPEVQVWRKEHHAN